MRNSEAAVTPMPRNMGETFVLGDANILSALPLQRPLPPFSEETLGLLSALSQWILQNRGAVLSSELATFAFWCRRAHLEQMKEESNCADRLGRGVSLHFAPSNIPLMFAYTMAAGLLTGNCVIVKLPAREVEQERKLLEGIAHLLESGFSLFTDRIVMLRCPHRKELTDYLSSLCDVRVIWGSNDSVQAIRKSPLPPRAIELPFAARSSAAVLLAQTVLETEELLPLVKAFYNDTYRNDQNACSSPTVIYWLGTPETVLRAKVRFWSALEELLQERQYQIQGSIAVQKLDAALQMAAKYDHVYIVQMGNQIVRAEVNALQCEMWDYIVPGGFFIEADGASLDALLPILTPYCQTLCVYGVCADATTEFLLQHRVTGVDRVVPVGHSLDFSLNWDGLSLVGMMSRRITAS